MSGYEESYDDDVIYSKAHDWSKKYNFSSAKFIVGDSSIDYKIINAPITNLNDDFKFFEEIPGIENLPVKLLIQRELDKKRAKEEIYEGYLKSDRIKFFSPLIVALVPYHEKDIKLSFDGETNHIADSEFETVFSSRIFNASKYKDDTDSIITVKLKEESTQGFFAWDRNNIHAVVIDGQHRLQSLVNYHKNKDLNHQNMTVPIVVLDFRTQEEQVVNIVRSIFIALNNTPKSIDPGRLILLNDRSIPSILTQEILNEERGGLLREYVDIKCDNGKHDSMYLTGVTTLNFILSDIFLKKHSIDLYDINVIVEKNKVKRFVKSLNDFLKFDKEIINGSFSELCLDSIDTLENIRTRTFDLDTDDDDDDPEGASDDTKFFRLKPQHFTAIRECFLETRLNIFTRIFKELQFFNEYWSKIDNLGIKTSNSILKSYLRKTESGRKVFISDLEPADKSELDSRKEKLKIVKNDIVFSTVGQKALFNHYYSNYYSMNPSDINETLSNFISDMNSLSNFIESKNFSKQFFSKDFQHKGFNIWRGVATNFESAMDNTFNSVKRITSFIILVQYLIENEFKDELFDDESPKSNLDILKNNIYQSNDKYKYFEYSHFKSIFQKNHKDLNDTDKLYNTYKDIFDHIKNIADILKS